MRKTLFAFAALLPTAFVIGLAWAVAALMSGALQLPRWIAGAILVAILAGLQLLRWRRRRGG